MVALININNVMLFIDYGFSMSSTNLQIDLIDLWIDIFGCSRCDFPNDYTPQFRPVETGYRPGGVVFAQINPGHIGRLTQTEIKKRYKNEKSRQRAHYKQKITSDLLVLQDVFLKNPSVENLNQLNSGYSNAVRRVWGWPPGKYLITIEKHGIKIDEVALINLAQCPIPKDKYTKRNFSNCWELHTKRIINALKPRLIVAQGKASFTFLQAQDLDKNISLIEGNHRASRQSNEIKNQTFNKVKSFIQQSRV